jgi:hypothetical protein
MESRAQASQATRLRTWKRWGLAAIAFYALKGAAWLVIGWTVLRD